MIGFRGIKIFKPVFLICYFSSKVGSITSTEYNSLLTHTEEYLFVFSQ